jgi:hypothetical protein
MSSLKDLSEELQSYIADAERLEKIVEAFREMDKILPRAFEPTALSVAYDKLKALIDE